MACVWSVVCGLCLESVVSMLVGVRQLHVWFLCL